MTKDRQELGNIKKDLIAVLSSELEMMSQDMSKNSHDLVKD